MAGAHEPYYNTNLTSTTNVPYGGHKQGDALISPNLDSPHGHQCPGTCCEGSPRTHSTPARGSPVAAPREQGYFWPSSFPQAPGDWVTPDAFLSPCRGQGKAPQRGAGIWKWPWLGLRFFGYSCPSAAATGISRDPSTRMLPARRKGSGTNRTGLEDKSHRNQAQAHGAGACLAPCTPPTTLAKPLHFRAAPAAPISTQGSHQALLSDR